MLTEEQLICHVFSKELWLTLNDIEHFHQAKIAISPETENRLNETREFIDFILDQKIQVYGITTGFADLRNTFVPPENAALLSRNLIRSHDAGIGANMAPEITLRAMIIRSHTLAKGYSGFSISSLTTLVEMINHKIIPLIPCTGSLGASGDLAYLARLGRAMMGDPVPVFFQGQVTSAHEALRICSIKPFDPTAKEGLALINGTTFMASMISIAYEKEMQCIKNLIALTGLFLNAIGAVDTAFYASLHNVRFQRGQSWVAQELLKWLEGVENRNEIQNDYSIRCLPQIYGPRFELILEQKHKIECELNAITDNPLIFRNEEITADVSSLLNFKDSTWAIISGGNFHGENLTAIADLISLSNAKIALTIERQLTYMMNPSRNKQRFPTYLLGPSGKTGLQSGFMITQYTANALTHKICLLAHPSGAMNLTSANESEDIVSYGATACQRLLEQVGLLKELLSIYLVAVGQAYSIARPKMLKRNKLAEIVFDIIQAQFSFPHSEDAGFGDRYKMASELLDSGVLSQAVSLNGFAE